LAPARTSSRMDAVAAIVVNEHSDHSLKLKLSQASTPFRR